MEIFFILLSLNSKSRFGTLKEMAGHLLRHWCAVTVTVLHVLLQPKLINFYCWLKDIEGITL